MPAIRRHRCWEDKPHVSDGDIRYTDQWTEEQQSRCQTCRQPITRFWIDEEPDERTGGWSAWVSIEYVIEEIGP
jgi:hypothetical protein